MFGFFKKKKKKEVKKRNLFEELFPLSEENRKAIDNAVADTQKKMFGDEGFEELRAFRSNYESNKVVLGRLEFDNFNWTKVDLENGGFLYQDKSGDTLQIEEVVPNGELGKETFLLEMPVYRNWVRGLGVREGGGIISCEPFELENGLTGTESILKIPREESTGMDYIYFVSVHSYEEQKLYQIYQKIHEPSPTGMRDNIFLFPLSEVCGNDVLDQMDLYRQDPYDKNYVDGNVMNISERAEFDELFPFHPLSIIRREVMPQMKESLKFVD